MGRYLNLQIHPNFLSEDSLNAINRDLHLNYGCPLEEVFNTRTNLQKYADYLNEDAEGMNEYQHFKRPVTVDFLTKIAVWNKIGFAQVKLSGGMPNDQALTALALAFWAGKNKKKIDKESSADYDLATVFNYAQDSLPRFNEIINEGKFEISDQKRQEIAKEAFWGNNELLADKIKDVLGYEMDNRWHPANGFTKADAQKIVGKMPASELLEFLKEPQYALIQDGSELLYGDKASIGMIFNNLTGCNFAEGFTEFKNYLTWAAKELNLKKLMPLKLSIAIK